ncbi:uncharacterized protein [Rutidosis leptorrhynchoides]|uniref:uncharacterized protein n=1 Tax=Rutidosis leptorrhynchoides TaxID=125765 RepID=UPI003A993F20
MSVRLVIQEVTYTVISTYAPHAGLGPAEKRHFWESLDEVVRMCPQDHRLLIGGVLNGHIGTDVEVVANSFFKKMNAQLATFHIEGHSTQIDYLLLRKGDLRTFGDCKKKLNGEKAETFKTLVVDRVDAEVDMVSHDDADQMWNCLASTFREAAKEALGVAIGTSRGHRPDRESWWLNDEVQSKVALKQLRFRDLINCQEGTPASRTRVEERYKEAKREAKCRFFLQTLVKEDEIQKRWEGYFSSLFIVGSPEYHEDPQDSEIEQSQNNIDCGIIRKEEVRSAIRKMGRNKAVGPDQIPIEAWRCLGEDGVRWLTCLFNKKYQISKMPMEWRGYVQRGEVLHVNAGGKTELFPIEVGLHQGSALSPFLFALILDELSRGIQEGIPWCLIFADDIVLISETKEELNRRLEQ